MKYVTKEMQATIERQMYNRGRDIDVAILNAMNDPEAKDFVLDCLMFYMNRDGGFANGLEIDNYNTNSTVFQTYEALRILSSLQFSADEENELFQEITQKIGNYLFNRCSLDEGRWNPLDITNNTFAHSEEYTYTADCLSIWQFHPTASIVGFILELYKPTKVYHKKALKLVGGAIDYLVGVPQYSEYDFISTNHLLGSLKRMSLFEEAQILLEEKLISQARKVIQNKEISFDIADVLTSCTIPSDLQPAIEECLDHKITAIAPHGLWERTKGWGSTKYPEEDSAMLKWLGAETVRQLAILRHYHRLEK